MQKTLQQWLLSPEIIPAKYNADGLAKMRKVCAALNLLEELKKAYIITVGGTNGKGSCVTFLESVLLAANYKVGAYTSPHLIFYNERIRINSINIDDDTLCAAFNKIEEACFSAAVCLTYFEIATLAALLIFSRQSLDIIILEVGLGGRFDAVNIVDSDIAIITTISLDHIEQLGDNREDIGYEKAGIMRPNKPIICGDFNPPQSICKNAAAIKANLYCINKDFKYIVYNRCWDWYCRDINLTRLTFPKLPIQNIATALMAISLLPQECFVIPTHAIYDGLNKAFLAGRFQIVWFNKVQVILDVAHNQASANLLAHKLMQPKFGGRTLAVASMLKDKDIAATFRELKSNIDCWYIGNLHNLRAASQQQMQEKAAAINLQEVFYYNDVVEAFKAAITACDISTINDSAVVCGADRTEQFGCIMRRTIGEKEECVKKHMSVRTSRKQSCKTKHKEIYSNDRIVVFGSFYTVAEVLKFMQSENGSKAIPQN